MRVDQRRERALVEPDLGVGEVVVVEQQQVGLGDADQLGHLGARALDVELDPLRARERAVAARSYRPTPSAVRAQHRREPAGRRRLLHHGERGERAVGVDARHSGAAC